MAWRIHHVAYVENLYPRRYSNFSTAFINPMFPSWIRSRKDRPRLVYFFAIEITSRRLDPTIAVFALKAWRIQPLSVWYSFAYSASENHNPFAISRILF